MEIDNDIVNSNVSTSNNRTISLNDVEIKDIGTSYIESSGNDLTINSYGTDYNLTKSMDNIDFLIYSKGNFLSNDKVYIGIDGEQLELTCKNNENGLKSFYDNLVRLKGSGFQQNNYAALESYNSTSSRKLSDNKVAKYISDNVDSNKQNSADDSETKSYVSEEIRNFYNLIKEGIISEEEFEEKKKELLKL